MADQSDSDSDSSASVTASSINLRILSPSPEVEGGIHFPALAASTTIAELKQKIQDAVPSKPATDRMRLIYRGRVVANADDALLTVFGSDTVRARFQTRYGIDT